MMSRTRSGLRPPGPASPPAVASNRPAERIPRRLQQWPPAVRAPRRLQQWPPAVQRRFQQWPPAPGAPAVPPAPARRRIADVEVQVAGPGARQLLSRLCRFIRRSLAQAEEAGELRNKLTGESRARENADLASAVLPSCGCHSGRGHRSSVCFSQNFSRAAMAKAHRSGRGHGA